MKYRILCYGDSNTWGYISGTDHLRYGDNERWTKLLQKKLGESFEVIEEGLNSRTLNLNDNRPGKEGKNGYDYLIPCLDTHDPIDLVVIMLGTNDLKTVYNKTIKQIGEDFENYFIKTILSRKSQINKKTPKILIISPPVVKDDGKGKFEGAYEKSIRFNEIYGKISEKYNCFFVNNEILKTGVDNVHLTKESHEALATKLYFEIKSIFEL